MTAVTDVTMPGAPSRIAKTALPAKDLFAPMEVAYLDSATMHPISNGAKASVESYLSARTFAGAGRGYFAGATEKRVLERFARLINASVEEVCFVPSTTAGEHLVLASLDLPAHANRIVTDTLHFPGSFYLYDELSRRGVDVAWLRPRDGQRIDIDDIEAAVVKGTKLVALSLVSTTNGFQHDLKKVCEIAHARGAYVYADIVHAAGCVPVDVKASGVDFAACSTYKWLMGDFGLGFLYVCAGILDRIKRTQFGYYQLAAWRTSAYPLDPPLESFAGYERVSGAAGVFAMGTLAHAALAQLDWSLEYISSLGVDAIELHRQPLLSRLKTELPGLGYKLMTPLESTAPLVVFSVRDGSALLPRLEAGKVKIAVTRNAFRVSTSVFNDSRDVDRLLDALS